MSLTITAAGAEPIQMYTSVSCGTEALEERGNGAFIKGDFKVSATSPGSQQLEQILS